VARGATAFPLALAWLDCPPGVEAGEARGNFVAVGTMLPGVELWDLDVLDATEPVMTLGGEDASAPKSKPGKKGKRAMRPGSHTDAVLGVAWNGVPRMRRASRLARR
jgi:periodic tryptophan protein 1